MREIVHALRVLILLLGCCATIHDAAYASCPVARFTKEFKIVSERVNGLDQDTPPHGKLQMWRDGAYRYIDVRPPGECGTFEYIEGRFAFIDGPLRNWSPGVPGEQHRSIKFVFENIWYQRVEIVMQETLGCSPWPECD